MTPLLKRPIVWLPIATSLLVLAVILISISVSGPPTRQSDEGTAAHLFQIWLFIEALLIGFFAIKWLPKKPKEAIFILVLQIIAVLLACAPVFYFNL